MTLASVGWVLFSGYYYTSGCGIYLLSEDLTEKTTKTRRSLKKLLEKLCVSGVFVVTFLAGLTEE